MKEFEALLSDEDPLIQEVGEIGRDYTENRYNGALKREGDDAVYGTR
jgi:hypothetical protein